MISISLPRRISPRLALAFALLMLLTFWLLWPGAKAASDGGGGGRKNGNQTLSVELAKAVVRPVPLTLSALGQVLPLQSVAVRSQVSGVITYVGFRDGADVAKGQVLFRLDPRPFRAAVDAAAAALQKDTAALSYARWKVERLAPQVAAGAASADTLEAARSDAGQIAAQVAADRANLAKARLDLEYSVIRAPIAARAGAAMLKIGNLVQAEASTPLVTLNQLAPVEVSFAIAQNDLASVRSFERTSGSLAVQALPLAANGTRVATSDGSMKVSQPVSGTLTFIDNAVAPASGTVALRAQFANAGRYLWPGANVRVELVLDVERDALVVPSSAVQQGQNGSFVYVVADGKAQLQAVKVTREQGASAVIGAGLKPGDQVVTQVPRNLRDGSQVKVGSLAVANAATDKSRGQGQGGGAGIGQGKGAHRGQAQGAVQ